MIDIKSLLDDLGIDYKEGGKNVGANDVNIDCPFCGADKHLGINRKNGKVNCWVCEFEDVDFYWEGERRKPTLAKVLVESTGEKWRDVKKAMEDWGWEPWVEGNKAMNMEVRICRLPKGSKPIEESPAAMEYLEKRGFDSYTARKYNLMVSDHKSYAGRIIIPVYFGGVLVNYTARDFTGKSDNRYKNAPLFYTVNRLKETLYNYDTAIRNPIHNHIYVLEGATDVWAIGEDSVGVFKSSLSPHQRNLLLSCGVTSLTIAFDPGAYSRALKAAEELEPFYPKLKVLKLEGDKDVAELGRKQILHIEKNTDYFRC